MNRQDPAAAAHALVTVLAFPPQRRIAGLHKPLRRSRALLDREPVRHSPEARELRLKIVAFLSETRPSSSLDFRICCGGCGSRSQATTRAAERPGLSDLPAVTGGEGQQRRDLGRLYPS
jgi:hypothetical protein